MFDVRPIDESGDLDLEKINQMEKVVSLTQKNQSTEKKIERADGGILRSKKKSLPVFEYEYENENARCGIGSAEYFQNNHARENASWEYLLNYENQKNENSYRAKLYVPVMEKRRHFFRLDQELFSRLFLKKMRSFSFLKIILSALFLAFILNFAVRGFELEKNGASNAQVALTEILDAKSSIEGGNFSEAYAKFNDAQKKFNQVSAQFDGMGMIFVSATKYVPYLSKISSANRLVKTGSDVSEVGIIISGMIKNLDEIKSQSDQSISISYLKIFHDNEDDLKRVAMLLDNVQNNLADVNVDDIPVADRAKFSEVKQALPKVNSTLETFLSEKSLLDDILGGNGPRKYLFLFQNNQEIRATGGFIGSYGLLDIFQGHVRKFFIDGIYNPDGQLQTKIVPPVPIQKISANWSLHDSNWFPNFPTSAEKAAWFYEKSGGPTVDGVITMTPTVMQKLLTLTGPIDMPEYGITVNKDNFIQSVQYQVEVDYDKELNNPKKILSDLAPKILDRILNMKSFSEMSQAMNVMLTSLNEKQILIYSKNPAIEKILSDNHWSGEILDTPKDYLSVVNTNINGFKTDGVVAENITHKTDIQADGSVIDNVTITRHHNGGDTPYEWWNQVNADYMRVYVPEGSQLISAEGQTREVDAMPLDYKALGYEQDPQVQAEETSAKIDSASGTKIYTESGKTVFANWVYVSPQETVTVKYSYLLPFKVSMDATHLSDTYSLLAQKQSGSLGSGLSCEIDYPSSYKTLWQSPSEGVLRLDGLPNDEVGIKIETDLKTDKFIGIAFTQ